MGSTYGTLSDYVLCESHKAMSYFSPKVIFQPIFNMEYYILAFIKKYVHNQITIIFNMLQ